MGLGLGDWGDWAKKRFEATGVPTRDDGLKGGCSLACSVSASQVDIAAAATLLIRPDFSLSPIWEKKKKQKKKKKKKLG